MKESKVDEIEYSVVYRSVVLNCSVIRAGESLREQRSYRLPVD